jgi:hypothetical protein
MSIYNYEGEYTVDDDKQRRHCGQPNWSEFGKRSVVRPYPTQVT